MAANVFLQLVVTVGGVVLLMISQSVFVFVWVSPKFSRRFTVTDPTILGANVWSRRTKITNRIDVSHRSFLRALRIMGSQNWWFGDPRPLLYTSKPLYCRVQWFLGRNQFVMDPIVPTYRIPTDWGFHRSDDTRQRCSLWRRWLVGWRGVLGGFWRPHLSESGGNYAIQKVVNIIS